MVGAESDLPGLPIVTSSIGAAHFVAGVLKVVVLDREWRA